MNSSVVSRANTLLDKTLGIKIKRTKWRQSKKPEWLDGGPIGMVDHFGRHGVTGWVSAEKKDFPIKVTLNINGAPVYGTWANGHSTLNSNGQAQEFFIGVRGIWDFCKNGDRLTIRVGDKVLPILNKGVYKKVGDPGTKTLDDLWELLSNGYVFNRSGELQLSKKLDTKWQKQVISLYRDIAKILKENHGITPFLMYGSLLGQVREGGFIGHDDDFDIAYVSKHRNGSEVVEEVVRIAKTLAKSGFEVDVLGAALHINRIDSPDPRIDLFHLYFDDTDELCFPFGVAGHSHFMLSEWEGVTKDSFADYTVTVPRNREKLVECIYGTSWRTPVVGFNWNHSRTRHDSSAIVPKSTQGKLNKKDKKSVELSPT